MMLPAPDISLWLSISTDTINNAPLWPTNAWRCCLSPSGTPLPSPPLPHYHHSPPAPPHAVHFSVWWRVRLRGQITTCPCVYGTFQLHTCTVVLHVVPRETGSPTPWLHSVVLDGFSGTSSAGGRKAYCALQQGEQKLLALQNKCSNKRSLKSCVSPLFYFMNKISLIS